VGDVAVTEDKIVYVGPHAGAPTAKTSIDAQGMIVAPGSSTFTPIRRAYPLARCGQTPERAVADAGCLDHLHSASMAGGYPRWRPITHSSKHRRSAPTSSAMSVSAPSARRCWARMPVRPRLPNWSA
jgi:hypothetical protein